MRKSKKTSSLIHKRYPSQTDQKGYTVSEKLSIGKIIMRTLGVLLMVILMAIVLIFSAITMVSKGPFPTAKDLFVVSVNETSAIKFFSRIYFSEEEVQSIILANSIIASDEVTDSTKPFAPSSEAEAENPIEIVDVFGSTYKGKMMIIKDPSRVTLSTLPAFGEEVKGKKIEEFVADSGAIAGINSGGFRDDSGIGKGGDPLGIVIKDGKIVNNYQGGMVSVIGFNTDDHLIVGHMSGQKALEMNMRDAVSFGPALIVNGNVSMVSGTGGGLNPRTAIGQRADGSVLLLVIDGRQPSSVGANFQDCTQIMLDFGAVNAANLDGGSSSMMVYDGEVINVCASLYGSRDQPTAWIVT